jgi:DNA-binding Lrp family transcriptional regulator
MVELSEIDITLLKYLLNDGRMSLTFIAKECSTSTDIVSKRLARLEELGLIVGATTQKNFPLLGYKNPALILANVDSSHFDQTCHDITSPSQEMWPQRIYGSRYDITVITMKTSLMDLDNYVNTLRKQAQITVSKVYHWLDVRNIPENLSLGSTSKENSSVKNKTLYHTSDTIKIDEIDRLIIEELSKHGRAPFKKIAQAINSSTDTVNRRYTRLTKAGAFKVSIQINPQTLGYKAITSFLIQLLHKEEQDRAIEGLCKIPDLTYLVKLSGDYDLLVVFLVRDFSHEFSIEDTLLATCKIGKMEKFDRKVPDTWPRPGQHMSTF